MNEFLHVFKSLEVTSSSGLISFNLGVLNNDSFFLRLLLPELKERLSLLLSLSSYSFSVFLTFNNASANLVLLWAIFLFTFDFIDKFQKSFE